VYFQEFGDGLKQQKTLYDGVPEEGRQDEIPPGGKLLLKLFFALNCFALLYVIFAI